MKTLEDVVFVDSERELLSTTDGIDMLGLEGVKGYPTEIIGAANKYIEALRIIKVMREMIKDLMD